MEQTGPESFPREITPLKRAIELDSNFALAYAALSVAYAKSGKRELAAEAARKAFESRGWLSERARLEISIHYYSLVTKEWDKVVETAELWISTYPNKWPQSYNLLAIEYGYRMCGKYEKALEAADHLIPLQPNSGWPYYHRAQALMSLNRFAEAKESYERAVAQRLDARPSRRGLYALAFIDSDAATMQQQFDVLRGQSDPSEGIGWQAETAAFSGQLQESARAISQRSGFGRPEQR